MTDPGEFDPTDWGMDDYLDSEGNFVYPAGFDPEEGQWREGSNAERAKWNRSFAEAKARFEASHKLR